MLTVYRIADARYPLFDGGGAQSLGGRWNSPGRRVIYAARSFAGALLEVLVHANTGRVPRQHRYIEIRIPAAVAIETFDSNAYPAWDQTGFLVSRSYGDRWYDSGRTAVLLVPSIVSQLEQNVLINQTHPQFALLRASNPEPVKWDQRLFPNRDLPARPGPPHARRAAAW